jgi:N-acetylglucosaminyldiphosphoundecaprenol N-acetyl-beta-D-mannosaminyltransferase
MKNDHPGYKPSTIMSMGYPIFKDSLRNISLRRKMMINTINQYSYCMAEKDPKFKQALKSSCILLPDGVAIVAAVKLLNGQNIKKIAGADLHQNLLEELNRTGGSCFYMGSSENTLQKIKDRLAGEYPNVKAGFYSPPFKAQFTKTDNAQIIQAVNAFKPDVLFIGMTAPRQEKWAYAHKDQLDAKTICSIGAVFDFYAGTVERPSAIWINLGLEWLGRLVKEPRRMWKRYIYYGPVFIYKVLREKVKPSA